MRTPSDRIRQAILFEAVGLVLITPLGSLVFDHSLAETGALALIGATVATFWHYLYNYGFDRLLARLTGGIDKPLPARVAHAIGFEGGLLILLLPVFSWGLGVSLMDALVMDLSFAGFYVIYAFVFTWAYDTLMPAPAMAPTQG